MKRLILIATVVLLSSSIAMAQTTTTIPFFCLGNFDYDGDVDADDVTEFLNHFGRSQYYNPCPPDGPTPVCKTGQTTSYVTGDDGDHQRGVPMVTPRFTDNADGTVTDNQTGLIWMKEANCFGTQIWEPALSECNGLEAGWCGLLDGSIAGDWRLPNYRELFSLVDAENYIPALPSGHSFTNVQSSGYWSSTTNADLSTYAWYVQMSNGLVGIDIKTINDNGYYIWPVRGGH